MVVKVFIVDKISFVRESVCSLLSGARDVSVAGTAAHFEEDRQLLRDCDVLMIEHHKDLEESMSMVREIRELNPKVKILLLSDRPEGPAFLNQMLGAGISGYVAKHAGPEELYYAIKKVAEEGIYICTAFILKFLETMRSGLQPDPKLAENITLNRGEAEVLDLVSEGLTNKEIASRLFVSVRTVESRRKNLLEKTNTSNTATLIRFCLKAGLIK